MIDRVWWFIIIYNIGLFVLIGWSVWYLDSLLPFIALIFSLKYSLQKRGDREG
jgi:hypothetical protein